MEKLKILLLEDNKLDAELTKEELKLHDFNFTIKLVDTEKDFINAILNFKPDLILSDYNLPKFTGFEALEIAKDLVPDIPFIIVTGSLSEETAVDSIKRGAWDYVIKENLIRLTPAIDNALKLKEEKNKNKIAEAELIKLSTAVTQSPSVIVITDLDGKLEYVNPKYTELTGYSSEEAIGQKSSILNLGGQTNEQDNELWNTIKLGKEWHGEFHNKKKNGEFFWEATSVSPIIDKQGKIINYLKVAKDITDRKETEEKLKESEKKYRLITTNTLDTVWTTDIESKMTFVNDAIFNFLGYTPEEFIGLDPSVFTTTDGINTIYDTISLLITKYKEGDINHQSVFEVQQIRKDGLLIDVEIRVNVLLDNEDNLIGFQGRSVDITKRKKAEKEIKESENRFQAFMNYMPAGIFIKNPDGYYLFSNKFNNDRFNINNIKGKTVYDFFPKELADKFTIEDRKVLKGENLITEGTVVDKYGKLFYYKNQQFAIEQSEGKKLIGGISFDVTKEKIAEKELLKLSAAVEQSPSVIAITDLKGNLEYVNPKFTEVTGYTFEEAKGLNPRVLKFGDQPEEMYNELWKAISEGKEWRGEFHNRKKNGEGFWEAASLSPIINDQGEIINYLKVAEDITERKLKEKELLIALKRATESDRLKSAFLATMSHELRTPLNAIIGFSSLIKPNVPLENIIAYAKTVNISGADLLSIIEDMFDITLIESGMTKIRHTDLNINSLLKETHKIIKTEQQKTKKSNLELNLILPSENIDLTVNTDQTKLKQIIINLIKNALKFTHEGKIDYGYSIETFQDKQMLRFYVKDTGIGIHKDKQEIIFDMFRQADDSHTRRFGGTGVGLSISKKLTELLGGKIWLESEVGKGSTFYFTIPYASMEKTVSGNDLQSKTEQNKKLKNKTILIVEDDEVCYEFLKIVLELYEANVIWAKYGTDSIKFCKENTNIDLVLMDINMPDMSGYLATKEIKKFRPDLPIIAQTAYAISGDREKSINAGCDDYITKPINTKALIEMIEIYLDK